MTNIKDIDLNLLHIFVVLMEELNVSSTAKLVGLSQPAVSYALNKLRNTFRDDLLVRGSRGMIATPKAKKLLPSIKKSLVSLEEALIDADSFELLHAEGEIRVSATDYFEHLLIPRVIKTIANESPKVRILNENAPGYFPRADLEKGATDLCVAAFFEKLPEGFYKQKLYEESFVGIARKNHPLLEKKSFSLKDFASEYHVSITIKGDKMHPVDAELKVAGLSRHISVEAANLMSAGSIIASSDCIMAVPSRVAAYYQRSLPISTFELPFHLEKFEISQIWHARVHSDPLQKWFRKTLKKACEKY